jgi:hypothetical protein
VIPEELRRRRLAAVRADALDDRVEVHGPKPYLDISLARGRLQVAAWLSLAGVAAAEVAGLSEGSLGTVLYGVMCLTLLIAGGKVSSRRLRALLWALAVVPTGRLVTFGAPLDELNTAIRLGLVGGLTLLATVTAIRAVDLSPAEVGLTAHWRHVPLAVLVGLVGLGLGIVERAFLTSVTVPDVSQMALLLVVGALGAADDLLMHGLVLGTARRVVGRLAVPFVGVLVAVLHIGYGVWPLVACALVVAMVFGWARIATGSLAVVVVGHLGLNVGIFLVGPDVTPLLAPLLSHLVAAVSVDLHSPLVLLTTLLRVT